MARDPSDVGGTKTGRLSCSNPNFQALPQADDDPNAIYKVRDLVVPRPGMKLAKLDYERAEVWMSASYCRDPKLIAAYHNGEDPYVEMAARLKITRKQAKLLHLMTMYGAGAWKIATALGWDQARAYDVRAAFFELYPSLRQSMRAYADEWEGRGALRLWTGRAVHYPGERPYAAWNRVLQGAVGEMVRVAMQRLEAPLATVGARMLLQVHDELVVEYPATAEGVVLPLCQRVMTDFDQFLLRPRVEPKVSGTNYAEMQPYDYKEAA
jgi:DNA polymerase-1